MIILGISGLDNSERYKRQQYPGLTDREYRLAQGADAAAALIVDGKIVGAVAEERFSRVKGTHEFPVGSINFLFKEAGIAAHDVDIVAHNFDYEPYRSYFMRDPETRGTFEQVYSRDATATAIESHLPGTGLTQKLASVPHHVAHAASAYYCSGFDDATILAIDGIGEFHSTTIFAASQGQMEIVRQVPGLHSLGILYGLITLHLGFFMNFDEYKVMGLAPYGDPQVYDAEMHKLIQLQPDGGYVTPVLFANDSDVDRQTFAGSLREIAAILGPPRHPDAPVTQRHKDIAAALQSVTTETLLHILTWARKELPSPHLCMAGGVALNCTSNAAIRRTKMFDDIFIQPAAGDDGTALGAALQVAYEHRRSGSDSYIPSPRMSPPLLGPSFDSSAIAEALGPRLTELVDTFDTWQSLTAAVADLLARGSVVAWFQGRMEFGPRALGCRSILADPRDREMRDKINAMVKKREAFRPLAPAVMAEYAHLYFDLFGDDSAYWYMLETAQVKAQFRDVLGAVIHVDGSARLQIVRRDHNEPFWLLLDAFLQVTGLPIVLNTSFNVRGQPIVCTPHEAIATFEATNVDYLVLDRHLLHRSALNHGGSASSNRTS